MKRLTHEQYRAYMTRPCGQLELPLAWVSRDRLTIPQNHTACQPRTTRETARTGRAVGDRAEAGRMERGDGLPAYFVDLIAGSVR